MIEDNQTNSGPNSRRDLAREKLLAAALDIFGRYGFDGATTRKLADAAGVNLQAIPYYFGGKEGLYIATAEYLTEIIGQHVAGLRQRIGSRLMELDRNGEALTASEARLFLTDIVQTMVVLFVSKKSESWARFLIREQMEPTEAFTRVYQGIMRPMIEMGRRLMGAILGEDPASENVRLRTLSFVGSILVFRMAHAAVLAQMHWDSIGEEQIETVRAHAARLVAALSPMEGDIS
ncbi:MULTISPECIES: CerR family C-terminal domain-containing protein [unclassified Sinorhizobium]|uniref:CerR family C-terminal domain-containing protein n=1 Tax=unclassified Sinorhizobium TaxID=2613772 RepID=UPI0035250D9B